MDKFSHIDIIQTVFDCNVLLQAMSNSIGPAGACFQAVRERRITLCVSHKLIAEFSDVASQPFLIRKLRLTEVGVAAFFAEVQSLARVVDPVPRMFEHPVDPKDTMIVNLAVAARAHVITSRDNHLLSLRDASTPAGADFMARFSFIDVLTPVELLNRLRTT